MSAEPSSYASVTVRPVLMSELYTMYNLNFPPLFREQNDSFSTRRCHFSQPFFSVSLLCKPGFGRFVSSRADTQISHESASFMSLWHWIFFFNHITNFCKSCPMWLFKVLLPSLAFFICTQQVNWVSLTLPAAAAVKTCFTCKINQNLGSSVRASRPFYFLQFQALTFKHCSSFSCPNTFLFDLPLSLFITEDTVKFQTHFLKNYGRMPRSSRLLNCFWILCGRCQAISIFGKALLTVSMLAMLWFQLIKHLVE